MYDEKLIWWDIATKKQFIIDEGEKLLTQMKEEINQLKDIT